MFTPGQRWISTAEPELGLGTVLRVEGRGVQVLLWSQHGQCDWWISAAAEESLRAFAAGLLELPGLRDTLWSNDGAGTRLIGELFDESRR